jgi:N-acetyl-beta-hexosaminidase
VWQVEDSPAYSHRGLLIDTSRNFITVPTIKQIISAMSYDKLNVFHWHITGNFSYSSAIHYAQVPFSILKKRINIANVFLFVYVFI